MEEYKATGLHITLDEGLACIDSLGTENEKDVPKCHNKDAVLHSIKHKDILLHKDKQEEDD